MRDTVVEYQTSQQVVEGRKDGEVLKPPRCCQLNTASYIPPKKSGKTIAYDLVATASAAAALLVVLGDGGEGGGRGRRRRRRRLELSLIFVYSYEGGGHVVDFPLNATSQQFQAMMQVSHGGRRGFDW